MLRADLRISCLVLILFARGLGGCAEGGETSGERDRERRSIVLDARIVTNIQRALGVERARAVDLAAEDALLAGELERRDPEVARYVRNLALARSLLEALGRELHEKAPVTDAEIEARASERWWEFDRPRMVRVVHALVRSQSEDAAAEALAARVRSAVSTTSDVRQFQKAAESVDAGSLSVKVESLPPLAADGRSIDLSRPPPDGPPPRSMAREFAEAASRLERPGEVSPVVRSPFGYHVILLLEVIEPNSVPLAERREKLAPEILGLRASAQKDELLAGLRREFAPDQERSALSVMEALHRSP